MAVERAKPKPGTTADGVHIVPPGAEAEFLRTFNLADIPMVGPKFQAKLASLGMVTVPDVHVDGHERGRRVEDGGQ